VDYLFYPGLLVPVTICGITDLRDGIVRNRVVLLTAVTGLMYHVFIGQGPAYSLTGGLVGLLAGYIGYRYGGMAGGDLKFITALGIWLGVHDLYWVLLIGSLIGVVWGVAVLLKHRQFLATVKEMAYIRYGVAFLRKIPEDADAPLPKDAIPFATCLALATWLVVALKGGHIW